MTLEKKLEAINDALHDQSSCIYNILFRNAGIGIQFYEHSRVVGSMPWKEGLVVYKYYPTLKEAVNAEYKRIVGRK